MSSIKLAVNLLVVLVSLPIWYYLLYKILQAVNATDLMWFLYWIYLPVGIVTKFISDLIKD